MPELKRCNIGCWRFKIPGWINVDIDPAYGDVVADIRNLPFEDESMEEIYLGHLLEHAHPSEFDAWFKEVNRVLAKDGKLTVTVPDIRKCLDLAAKGDMTLEAVSDAVYGKHDRPEQVHKSVFDTTIMLHVLNHYFKDAKDIGQSKYAPFRVPWQTSFECLKK